MNESLVLELLNATQENSKALLNQSNNYWAYIIIGVVSSFSIYIVMFMPSLLASFNLHFKIKALMKKMVALNGRHLIVMSHKSSGLFGSMITMEDVMKVEALIRKFGKGGIDLILNTPGGDLLASLRLAKLVKGSDMRVMVPKYAWSGGTLVSIASPILLMGEKATLSPVDPQLGTLWKYFGAKYWQEIRKVKGIKADDESVAMARMSKEIMEEMKGYLKELRPKATRKFMDLFLNGGYTHANQLSMKDLSKVGIKVSKLDSDIPDMIVESLKSDGVFGLKLKNR